MSPTTTKQGRWRSARRAYRYGVRVALSALAAVAVLSAVTPAGAQGVPRPSAPVPYPPQQQQGYPPRGYQEPARRQPSQHEMRCIQLEQELANDWARRQQGNDMLPQIDADIRKNDRIFQSTQARAERAGCYERMFIFGRQLRRTPRCLKMHRTIENARRELARLQEQRARLGGRGSARQRRDDLIQALARAGCGSNYQREARRRGGWFTSLFQDDSYYDRGRDLQTSRIEPFATYRTLCVRTCDGYYFPVSYSTLPSRFGQDVAQCRSRCAAPAELFVYRNPGEQPEQMVSSDGSQAYNDLPNAWRYRKEYIKGCSCKETEYDPAEIAAAEQKKADEAAGNTADGATPGPPSGQVAQDPQQAPNQQ